MPKNQKMYNKGYKKNYVSKGVKKYVSKQLKKNIELKTRIFAHTAVGQDIVAGTTPQSFASVSYGSASICSALCAGIANGTGNGQRIGSKIKLKGIHINFACQPGDNTNYLRYLIVAPYGQIADASVSAFVTQLLSNASSSTTQWANPPSTDNFKILYDKQMYLTFKPLDGSTATTLPQTKFVKKFIKLNKTITWDLSSDPIPTQEVYLVAISDSAVAANPGAVAGFVRLWYTDS